MHTASKILLAGLMGFAALQAQAETRAVIDTNMGKIELSLDEKKAPKTVANFVSYAEKGFYNNIMGTSAVFSIFCDSIKFDKQNMEFTYYGRQRIERRTNILTRELVTAGKLKRVPRTDNNPHGLLIVNWRTLLNKDIDQKTKVNY